MKDIDKKDVTEISGGVTDYPTSGLPYPDSDLPYPPYPIAPIVDDPWITDPNPDYERQT